MLFGDGEPQNHSFVNVMHHHHYLFSLNGAGTFAVPTSVCLNRNVLVLPPCVRDTCVSCGNGAKVTTLHRNVCMHAQRDIVYQYSSHCVTRPTCLLALSHLLHPTTCLRIPGDGKAGGVVRGVPVRAAPAALRSHGKLLLLAHHTRYVCIRPRYNNDNKMTIK